MVIIYIGIGACNKLECIEVNLTYFWNLRGCHCTSESRHNSYRYKLPKVAVVIKELTTRYVGGRLSTHGAYCSF